MWRRRWIICLCHNKWNELSPISIKFRVFNVIHVNGRGKSKFIIRNDFFSRPSFYSSNGTGGSENIVYEIVKKRTPICISCLDQGKDDPAKDSIACTKKSWFCQQPLQLLSNWMVQYLNCWFGKTLKTTMNILAWYCNFFCGFFWWWTDKMLYWCFYWRLKGLTFLKLAVQLLIWLN